MVKKIFQMFLFIMASMAIIIIVISPTIIFNGPKAREIRSAFTAQKIAPQRLFIASWRNIKSFYVDPSMNNQDWIKWKYRYLKHIKTDEDVAVAINTMLASLNDPHSEFFDKKKYTLQEQYIRENSDSSGSKRPSGATVRLKSIAGIVQSAIVINNSPFYTNPQKGDILLSINNYEINGMEMNSAVKLIRGTSPLYKIKVLRKNKIETLSVIQGSMGIAKLDAQLIDDNIIYISIFSLMGQNAPKEFRAIMQKYKNSAKGYIIDLRGDVGGLFLNAVYIADELIEKGEIVTIQYRDGSNYTINAEIPSDKYTKPIIILVNNKTASSSEILAGALRSNNKALLVGEPTFGKNEVQQIIPMPNNTCINLTTAKYKFNDNYNFTDGVLKPDYIVNISGKDILNGNDTQLKKACELIKNWK